MKAECRVPVTFGPVPSGEIAEPQEPVCPLIHVCVCLCICACGRNVGAL